MIIHIISYHTKSYHKYISYIDKPIPNSTVTIIIDGHQSHDVMATDCKVGLRCCVCGLTPKALCFFDLSTINYHLLNLSYLSANSLMNQLEHPIAIP